MVLNWQKNEFFSQLMHHDKRAHPALEMLVDDLHADKDRTINKFLCHSGSEDFLWGLVALLGSDNSRVAGNSAYILGTLAESENGCFRVLSLTSHSHPDARRILPDLTNMLLFDDSESVMNAAGTMGTLAESQEGRQWMLSEPCLGNTIQYITHLLNSDNLWTASNAALVLARLTISEEGCEQILNHTSSDHVLAKLIQSLGVDEAGRGMNAAFAIGRLCDMEAGRSRLLGLPESERMVSLLARMLCCNDPGASKNACFAMSCLATSKEGHSRLLKNSHSDDVLRTLSELLSSEDGETGWFAAMTLRTLASQPKGCLRLRDHPSVLVSLQNVESQTEVNDDLYDEVLQTAQILKRLVKPQPPRVTVKGARDVEISWEPATTNSGFTVRYQLFEGTKCIYHGKELLYHMAACSPHTNYAFRVRSATEGDDSALSDVITVTTEEATPGPPVNVRILGCSTTQLKIGWQPPRDTNGVLKGYHVYHGERAVDHTYETHSIITGLQHSSSNQLAVCAATSKGKGPKVEIMGTTVELGAHAPSKPDVTVRGRFELHICWKPPEVPLGKITRYDVRMNGDVIYSGMDLHHDARRLRPDTEYTVTVSAITNEGKCESKTAKKKTAKDDYEGERAPLYQPPRKEPSAEMDKREEFSPPKSPTKKARKESFYKPRSASAASVKTVKDAHVTESAADSTRPVSTVTRKQDQYQQQQEEVEQIPQRSQTSISRYSRPKSNRATSSNTHRSVHSDGPRAKAQLSKTHTDCEVVDKLQSELSTVSHETRSISNPSPKPDRKILPKPKPPNVRKPRRTSQTLLLSRSTDQLDQNSQYNAHARANTSQNNSHNVSQSFNVLENSEQKENVALYESIDHSRGIEHSRGIDHSRAKILPKPKQLREWTNTQKGGSRRPILKKRAPVSGSIEEAGPMDQDALKPAASTVQPNKSYDYQKGDESLASTGAFTTLSGGHFRPADTMHRSKTGMIEFDAPLPQPSHTSGMTPSYVQRANTLIERQRVPTRRSIGNLRSSQPFQTTGQQWTPDFPSQALEKSHSKFVPMQFRTQPANLPGGMRRQTTQMNHSDSRVGSSLEVAHRCTTEYGATNHAPTVSARFLDQSEPPRQLSTGHGQYMSHTPRDRGPSATSVAAAGSEHHGHVTEHHGHVRHKSSAQHTAAPASAKVTTNQQQSPHTVMSLANQQQSPQTVMSPANQQQSPQTVMSLAVNQSAAPHKNLQSAR